ncbi:unnamed protein product [Sphenostylis stenocarpa]|uniref:Pectinesterase n=1 Tax=Sphenostylis stenocarpa TaxID=92480 RepID=A0AA86TEI4_9FABA|nr:unnamed protein product [Sphenostylis stenocarpa]
MSGHDNGREQDKRFAIVLVSTILIVAMVPEVASDKKVEEEEEGNSMSTFNTMVNGNLICQSTEHRDLCEKTLGSSLMKVTDPKKLLEAGFNASVAELLGKINNSTLYNEMAVDNMTRQAMDICTEVLDYAVDGILKSTKTLDKVDINKLSGHIFDLKVWLTGSIAHQYTCLQGFESLKGMENISKAMAQVLRVSLELTDNALDMTNVIQKVLKIQSNKFANRRLLSPEATLPDGFHSWVGEAERRFLQSSGNYYNAVVAQDGSGQFKTVNEALRTVPYYNDKPFFIHVKAGTYTEKVEVTKAMTHVTMIGDGPRNTIFTGSLNYVDGVVTFNSATFGREMGFKNTAGSAKHQAVALMATGDKIVFHNCFMDGHQDTLFAQSQRQFYRNCVIRGTIDFVFGDALGVFQNCRLVAKVPLREQKCMMTASGRSTSDSTSGLLFQGCYFTGFQEMLKANPKQAYLGRPWHEYSRVVIMDSRIDDVIAPEGYEAFTGHKNTNTCTYYEYNNRGPGSDTSRRVQWPGFKVLSSSEASQFYPSKFFDVANSADGDKWIVDTGIPYYPGPGSGSSPSS